MADKSDTGAMPGSDATSGQSTASSTSNGATPQTPPANAPATGEEALGDTGRQILREARATARAAEERALAAERERDELRTQSQSEAERAVNAAKRAGILETTAKFQAQLRRASVKSSLVAAGVTAELIDLAARDDVFADLKVSDDGEVEGLDEAVSELRKARPSLFARPGDFGGGRRGTTPPTVPSTNELLRTVLRG